MDSPRKLSTVAVRAAASKDHAPVAHAVRSLGVLLAEQTVSVDTMTNVST
jgi:hypothetical protein